MRYFAPPVQIGLRYYIFENLSLNKERQDFPFPYNLSAVQSMSFDKELLGSTSFLQLHKSFQAGVPRGRKSEKSCKRSTNNLTLLYQAFLAGVVPGRGGGGCFHLHPVTPLSKKSDD